MGAVDLLLKDDTLKRHFAALPPIHQAAVNWQLEWSQKAHDHQIEVEVHQRVWRTAQEPQDAAPVRALILTGLVLVGLVILKYGCSRSTVTG